MVEKRSTDVILRSSDSLPNGHHGEALGELSSEPGSVLMDEDATGGLGRHLGLCSTTFLMWVRFLSLGIDIIANPTVVEV